jgi:hypothetical protein
MFSLYVIAGFTAALGALWAAFAARYFFAAQGISGVGRILPSDMSYIIFAAGLPVILLLMVAAIALFAVANRANRAAFVALLRLNKGEIESLAGISKSLQSLEKLGFSSRFFAILPTIFDDMALALADVVSKTGMAGEEVLADALAGPGDGRLWAVCRIILDLRESTPHFDENLRRRAKRDENSARAIDAVLGKYVRLSRALAAHDVDGLVRESVEGGVLGKVCGVLGAALANEGSMAEE